jgi:hypothetical protein
MRNNYYVLHITYYLVAGDCTENFCNIQYGVSNTKPEAL